MDARRAAAILVLLLAPGPGTSHAADSTVFVGSTPADTAIRERLGIAAEVRAERVKWKLTLSGGGKTPSQYELQYEYGERGSGRRHGTLSVTRGIASSADVLVYELDGAVNVAQVHANLLQVLNPDRSLMIGNGGWSYTLNRSDRAEALVDARLSRRQPDMTYPISAASIGPTVFGVFQGRTPCRGIARQLQISVPRECTKAKWRVTLYQDAATQMPTTYKIEGGLFQRGAREGNWRTGDDGAYRLDPTPGQSALRLLKGDDNVLFMLDKAGNPLVGHADFSYTLDRAN